MLHALSLLLLVSCVFGGLCRAIARVLLAFTAHLLIALLLAAARLFAAQ